MRGVISRDGQVACCIRRQEPETIATRERVVECGKPALAHLVIKKRTVAQRVIVVGDQNVEHLRRGGTGTAKTLTEVREIQGDAAFAVFKDAYP
jgi:hypothetical protein